MKRKMKRVMNYIEELEYNNLKKELKVLEKEHMNCVKKLEYDPIVFYFNAVEKLNNEKDDLSLKMQYAEEANKWREKAVRFDLISYLDKWQNKLIEIERCTHEIKNRLFTIERRIEIWD